MSIYASDSMSSRREDSNWNRQIWKRREENLEIRNEGSDQRSCDDTLALTYT